MLIGCSHSEPEARNGSPNSALILPTESLYDKNPYPSYVQFISVVCTVPYLLSCS